MGFWSIIKLAEILVLSHFFYNFVVLIENDKFALRETGDKRAVSKLMTFYYVPNECECYANFLCATLNIRRERHAQVSAHHYSTESIQMCLK